uniref:Peptidase M28 domain-containing protein n=1 Tax=Setaria digitata TaxID=48799 RepID=A0A915PWL7_9BILA
MMEEILNLKKYELSRSLQRSLSLNQDDVLRISGSSAQHAATVSTSLSTVSTSRNLFQSTSPNKNFTSQSVSYTSDHKNKDEFRWLLLNEGVQQNFGSCITMECNCNWKNRNREDDNNDDESFNLNSNNLMGRRRTILIPLLLSIALIFFMIMTMLLILVIFLSTKPMKLVSTAAKWNNVSLNGNSANAYGIRQNLLQQAEISQKLMDSFNAANIKKNIKWLSEKVHVAGTEENAELMKKIVEKYRRYGYDVRTYSYNVLLNYPNYEKPNRIELNIGNEKWKEVSNGLAERLGPKGAQEQQADPRALLYWVAYSGNGSVTGLMVYVNYGTADDYARLDKYGISVKGKIVLCRYGALFRGNKVKLAMKHGAIGMILYSDPFDYTNRRYDQKVFPNEIWLPASGAQRGTLLKTDGDPETPLLPSKYYTYRTETEKNLRDRHVMPSIPVMPIGYRDARKIMENFNGPKVKLYDWIGSMNVTYRITGSAIFRVTVHSTCTHRIITNIIGTMPGSEEPDRYVLFSNHYDAWVKGAIDPISATGTMLEMARVLSRMKELTKWRPRRTIMFCLWDAEEFGLIGKRSTEWVEEFMKPLEQRAVALINVDNINGDTLLSVKAVPLLYRIIVNAASKIKSPNIREQEAKRMTLLDSWKFYDPKGPISGDRSIPNIGIPGTGSDFQRFITYLGIPVIDMKLESAPLYTYMLYHTMYEVPWLLDNFLHPNYTALVAIGQLWLEIGRDIADSLIIPFNLHDYGLALADFVDRMEEQLDHIGIPKAIGTKAYRNILNNLHGALKRFQVIGNGIQEIVQSINLGQETISTRQAEMLNSRMQFIERAFIAEQGIYPERAEFRHLIFTSNSIHNDYGNLLIGGILDPALQWQNALIRNDLNKANYWLEHVKIGFSKLQYSIESAILILNLDGYYD